MSQPTSDAQVRSWLCPEPGDRERLLDMDWRLRQSRTAALLALAIVMVACAPWVSWWILLIPAGLAVGWRLLDHFNRYTDKPEWILAIGWLLSVVGIFAGTMMTGGIDSPAKSWLLIPALALPARFHKRGLYAGVAICIVALVLEALLSNASRVADAPQELLFPLAMIVAGVAMSMALRNAELQHRSEAVIDQLTGMLNRKALQARTVELELQSQVTRQPVGLIVCDIDNFKQVNDEFGHATGDAVLSGFAYRVRKELRAYDLAYRLGGEEFVILVPGADLDATSELAERLRAATDEEPIEGVDVSASFGVAASAADGFGFDAVFAAADAALYRAKDEGRNRVCAAGDAERVLTPA